MKSLREKLQRTYGLSPFSAAQIMDIVKAFDKYEELPPATKDDVQIISDMHGVIFSFTECKRNRIALTGITIPQEVTTYLYTDETLELRKTRYKKSGGELHVIPGGGNKLFRDID